MLRTTPLIILCLLGAACASQTKMSSGPKTSEVPEAPLVQEASPEAKPIEASAPAPKPRPWTQAFKAGAILVGDTIRVEGPPGLMVHAALTVDDTLCILEQRSTKQGFLQIVTARAGAGREMRCQLDRWTLAAGKRIEILERFGPCDVTVVAEGSAFWRDLNGNVKRGKKLEFLGEQPEQ